MKRIYFLISGLFIFSIHLSGQIVDFENDKYWIDAGAGVGVFYSTDKTDGFSGNLSLNLIRDSTLYKIRFLRHDEYNLFGPSPSEEFYSIGILIGKGYSGKYQQIKFSGGLGITGGVQRGEFLYTESSQGSWFPIMPGIRHYQKDRFITPSVQLEIDMIFKPIKYLGVGFALWGDINYIVPMYGIMIKVGFGKLR